MLCPISALVASTALVGPAFAAAPEDVARTCADIAEATHGDSLTTAQTLQTAVRACVAAPSGANMIAARGAWLAARVPCMQDRGVPLSQPRGRRLRGAGQRLAAG